VGTRDGERVSLIVRRRAPLAGKIELVVRIVEGTGCRVLEPRKRVRNLRGKALREAVLNRHLQAVIDGARGIGRSESFNVGVIRVGTAERRWILGVTGGHILK